MHDVLQLPGVSCLVECESHCDQCETVFCRMCILKSSFIVWSVSKAKEKMSRSLLFCEVYSGQCVRIEDCQFGNSCSSFGLISHSDCGYIVTYIKNIDSYSICQSIKGISLFFYSCVID